MYVIQTDQQSWVQGIWRGWLTTCSSPAGALIYQDLSKAEAAAEYYGKLASNFKFFIRPLMQQEQLRIELNDHYFKSLCVCS
jgi:hypothetical protein